MIQMGESGALSARLDVATSPQACRWASFAAMLPGFHLPNDETEAPSLVRSPNMSLVSNESRLVRHELRSTPGGTALYEILAVQASETQ